MLACHLLTHRLATRNHHLQFDTMQDMGLGAERAPVSPSSVADWLDWKTLWGLAVPDNKREFVVTEAVGS